MTQSDFETYVSEIFNFLVTDYGFHAGACEENNYSWEITYYLLPSIAIEIRYDRREDHIEVKLARLVQGIKPAIYEKDEHGKYYQIGLFKALITKGIRDFNVDHAIKQLGVKYSIRLPENITKEYSYLLQYAYLLRTYCTDVLKGKTEMFDELS